MENNAIKATNYLKQLFLRTNYKCDRTKLEELAIIADLKKIKRTGKTIFDDSIQVEDDGFSIVGMEKIYPKELICGNLIMDYHTIQKEELKNDKYVKIDLKSLNLEDKKILEETFYLYGAYGTRKISSFMNKLQLHTRESKCRKIKKEELIKYVQEDLKGNIAFKNFITQFIN